MTLYSSKSYVKSWGASKFWGGPDSPDPPVVAPMTARRKRSINAACRRTLSWRTSMCGVMRWKRGRNQTSFDFCVMWRTCGTWIRTAFDMCLIRTAPHVNARSRRLDLGADLACTQSIIWRVATAMNTTLLDPFITPSFDLEIITEKNIWSI